MAGYLSPVRQWPSALPDTHADNTPEPGNETQRQSRADDNECGEHPAWQVGGEVEFREERALVGLHELGGDEEGGVAEEEDSVKLQRA